LGRISRRREQVKTKSIGLAAIALGCSIGVAAAQGLGVPNAQAGSGLTAEQQQALQAVAKQHAALGLAAGTPYAVYKSDLSNLNAAVQVGFVGFHAYNCGWFTNGTNNIFYIFPQEGGLIETFDNIIASIGLQIGCAQANLMFINVISSSGAFNQNESFPYRP
jgi:hypothetical protein